MYTGNASCSSPSSSVSLVLIAGKILLFVQENRIVDVTRAIVVDGDFGGIARLHLVQLESGAEFNNNMFLRIDHLLPCDRFASPFLFVEDPPPPLFSLHNLGLF